MFVLNCFALLEIKFLIFVTQRTDGDQRLRNDVTSIKKATY